jgi:phosphoserine phosphatase
VAAKLAPKQAPLPDAILTMSHVATLIASRELPDLAGLAARAADALGGGEAHWLAPAIAVDIPFEPVVGRDERLVAQSLRGAIGDTPIDVVVQPVAARRKRLLLADMDSTMIGQECLDELADFVGQKARVAAITERAMRGEIAFEPALKERVALLAGLSARVVDEVIEKRITLTPGGRALVGTMAAHGAHTCLVSGGFTLFTGPIAAAIGFAENRGNRLEVEGGRFTGRVLPPILGRDAKLATLIELRAALGLEKRETLVVGDGANDLLMISDGGLGVAYHAKPVVAAAAGARIDHCDLTALLYAQGYAASEIGEHRSGSP